MITIAWPAIRTFGVQFLATGRWNPNQGDFGVLTFLWGTLYSSCIALALGVPISLSIPLFVTQWAPRSLRRPIGFLVEMLVAIPSVGYGLWGIWVLVPFIRPVEVWLSLHAGMFPALFSGAPYGFGMLAAGLLLALMILPTITAISRDVI